MNVKKLKIPDFSVPFVDCKYQALLPVLFYYGEDVSNLLYDIFYYYNYYENDDFCGFSIETTRFIARKDKLKKIGIIQYDYYSNKQNIVNIIISAIEQSKPVVIRIDLYYDKDALRYYQKTHWAHYLMIFGYDLSNMNFFVFDSINGTDYHYSKKIKSFECVMNAYNGFVEYYVKLKHLNKPTYMLFSYEKSIASLDKNELFDVMKQEIHKYKNISMVSMELFFEDIKKFINYFEDDCNSKFFINKLSEICISKRVIQYLQEIPSLYMNANYEQQKINQVLLSNYTMLRALLTKSYYSKLISEETKNKMLRVLSDIEKQERKFYELF